MSITKIYMIRSKEFNIIQGIWTNPDTLVDWVRSCRYSWTEVTRETDLDVFMDRNQLSVFQDGIEHSEKHLPWSELFPTE